MESSQFFLRHVSAQGVEPLGGVDELHLALARLGFPGCEHPNIGGNAVL